MTWATPLLVMALAASAPDVKNRPLAEGMQLYESLDYPGALQALTRALDLPSSRRDFARIHLYIGLIQHRYKLSKDAEDSFTKALDYDSKIRPPKSATKNAKTLFRKILRAKLGDAADVQELRAEDPKKRRKMDRTKEDSTATLSADIAETSTATGSRASAIAAPLVSPAPVAETDELPPPPSEGDGSGGPPHDDKLPGLAPSPAPGEGITGSAPPLEVDSSGPFVGWIAIGVGVAAVATGVTLGALSGNNASAADAEPVAKRAEQLFDTAVQQRTLAFLSFGVSGVSLGVAALLFLMD